MPRCDDCTNRRCSCVIVDGDNTTVEGTGRPDDPFKVNAEAGAGSSRITGEIIQFGGAAAPTGWLLCDGQAVSRTTYDDLFAVLGTTYGVGDGSTTFNVPDLAGRFAFGADGSHPLGSVAGLENITLTQANLPAHQHSIAHTHDMVHWHDMSHGHGDVTPNGDHHHSIKQSDSTGSNNGTFARGGAGARDVDTDTKGNHSHTVGNFNGPTQPDNRGQTGASSAALSGSIGSGAAHTNMPPYVAVTYLIKT